VTLARLSADAALGNGAIYQCRGDWGGAVARPSPDVLVAKMDEYGFDAIFRQGEELECPRTELVGFIRTQRAGLRVIDAYHAIGALGGTDGGVWESECTQAEFDANLLSRDIGDLAGEVYRLTRSLIKAATGGARAARWFTDNWQLVAILGAVLLVVVLVVYLNWKRGAA